MRKLQGGYSKRPYVSSAKNHKGKHFMSWSRYANQV
jgi:hypothetical protein